MVKLVVVDRSAEARARIVDQINGFLRADLPELEFMPRISIKPLSPEELKFHGAPDICIVGSEMLTHELTAVAQVKRTLPDTPVVARTSPALAGISTVEQLVRLGADDVMPGDIAPAEFVRKIIILARRRAKARSGKLVLVESGKGGLGVTSLTAALGECLVERGKKTALLDFDFETQDLSRFLQARPFVNENLQFLFDQSRPVTQETVEQCLVPVWCDEHNLACMPPPAESDRIYDSQASCARILISVLEILDTLYDCVLVDGGGARGAFLKTLLRTADHALFVINNDPAAIYASVDKLTRLRGLLSAGAGCVVAENASLRSGLAGKLLRGEFTRAAKLEASSWARLPVPYGRSAGRWPGSGGTLYSQGGAAIRSAIESLAEQMGLAEAEAETRPAAAAPERSWAAQTLETCLKINPQGERLLALPPAAPPDVPAIAAEENSAAAEKKPLQIPYRSPSPTDAAKPESETVKLISGASFLEDSAAPAD